jgi:lysophospholipase L1-like esterase
VPSQNEPRFSLLNRRSLWHWVAASAFAIVLAACGGGADTMPTPALAAAWTASQSDLNEDLSALNFPAQSPTTITDQTVRELARVAIGGSNIRIKFSNRFGASPLTLDKARVARWSGAAAIDPSTDHAVTFAGAQSVTIAAGAEAWSDPVDMTVPAQTVLAVSLYIKNATIATAHRFATVSTYVGSGDQTSAPVMSAAAANARSSAYFMSEIDVEHPTPATVVVAFGDSITQGVATSTNAFLDWPSQLANRLATAKPDVSVVNAGLSGNRWLNNIFGVRGLDRFSEDVLKVTGVTHTIIFMGINDLGLSQNYPSQTVTADQVIGAMATAIAQAKAKKIKVFLGTITPFKGAAYYTDAGEAKRQAINAWIRANKDVDGVVDFDKVLQDSADPLQADASLVISDHLHPNDVGQGRMAAAVDLSWF